MIGRKKLSEIKAELGLTIAPNGKPAKAKPKSLEGAKLEKFLTKQLAELERDIAKRRKPKKRQRATRRKAIV